MYANGAYTGEGDIGRLMADFRTADPKEMYFSALADRVKSLKYSERGVTRMCRAMEITFAEGLKEGIAKGRAEGRADAIQRIMKALGLSLEKAMDVLEIPAEERQKYRELLERQS